MSKESINSVTGTPGATADTMKSFAGKWALITGASSGLGLESAGGAEGGPSAGADGKAP